MRLSHVCVDALLRICAAAISDDRPCRDTWPADLHIFWVVSKLSKPPACCRYGLGCCERSPGVGALCASRDQLTVCVDLHSLLDVGQFGGTVGMSILRFALFGSYGTSWNGNG